MSVNNIKNKRKLLFFINRNTHRYQFNKNDKRPKETRYCAVCGRLLVKYNIRTDKFITVISHYKFNNTWGIPVCICKDIRSCKNYSRKEE
mgnify:CR=1 FL=1